MASFNYELFDREKFEEWSNLHALHKDEIAFFERHLCDIPRNAHILDIGTGCGRFIFGLLPYGFRHFSGIDMSKKLIEVARGRRQELQVECEIDFSIQNASDLAFADYSKDVVIACQQIYCLIEERDERKKALSEAYRVLEPGGVILLSVLNWEGRWYNPLIAAAVAPFKILKREWKRLNRQYLCWLNLGFWSNFKGLFGRQPYTYWYRRNEIEGELVEAGFSILDVASAKMLVEKQSAFEFGGMLFVAARKPLPRG